MIEASRKVGPWREAVVRACVADDIAGLLLDEPVTVSVEFLLPRPKSHLKVSGLVKDSAPEHVTTVPDVDKLLRSTLDALTKAAVIVDDSRVVAVWAVKKYAKAHAGAVITIESYEELD
jgi:crossover junction endodeoxyribonuclease RusA